MSFIVDQFMIDIKNRWTGSIFNFWRFTHFSTFARLSWYFGKIFGFDLKLKYQDHMKTKLNFKANQTIHESTSKHKNNNWRELCLVQFTLFSKVWVLTGPKRDQFEVCFSAINTNLKMFLPKQKWYFLLPQVLNLLFQSCERFKLSF